MIEVVRGHLVNLYKEYHEFCLELDGPSFCSISDMSMQALKEEFNVDEVLDGLKSCDGIKLRVPMVLV